MNDFKRYEDGDLLVMLILNEFPLYLQGLFGLWPNFV